MASWRRMEDSENLQFVGSIEAGPSFIDVALFLGVYHSIISWLRKQFQIIQIVVQKLVAGHPRVKIPEEDQYIVVVAKRNLRLIPTNVKSMVEAHW